MRVMDRPSGGWTDMQAVTSATIAGRAAARRAVGGGVVCRPLRALFHACVRLRGRRCCATARRPRMSPPWPSSAPTAAAAASPGAGHSAAWLFGIARNAALDELRRRGRQATLAAEHEDGTLTGTEAGRRGGPHAELLRAALADLAPRERELVALKFSGGLTNAELAHVIGTSESNAGTRLHRSYEAEEGLR